MIVRCEGQPPVDLFVHPCQMRGKAGKRFAGDPGDEVWFSTLARAQLRLRPGFFMGELRDILYNVGSRTKRVDEPGYGGDLVRVLKIVGTSPKGAVLSESWQDLLGPIRPWEAWQAALRCGTALQGIEVHVGPARYRFHPEGLEGERMVLSLEAGGRPWIDLSGRLLGAEAHLPDLRPQFVTAWCKEDFPLRTLRLLVTLGEILELPRGCGGWRLANVWREGVEFFAAQAAALDMKPYQLRERLERRKRAADRKRK